MEVKKQRAYRYLLYAAALDIRPLEWMWYRGLGRVVPWASSRQRRAVRRAGVLAAWLHNLAEFSALEFQAFDEGTFWRDHRAMCARYPTLGLERYRAMFDSWLSLPEGEWPGAEMWAALRKVAGK